MALTLTHLRIDCIATTPIKLGRFYAGNNLRNAMANVMLRATCPEGYRRGQPPPEHVAACPACWLLAADLEPGRVVRAYAVVPPLPPRWQLQPEEPFSFALTLFGDGFRFLPYLVLALNEVGQREGIGPRRWQGWGRFRVQRMTAVNPLRRQTEVVLAPGQQMVQVPSLHVTWPDVAGAADDQHRAIPASNELTIRFHTPLRIVERNTPYKVPDFSAFFQRLLWRIDELGRQFAGQDGRPAEDVERLHRLAQRVRLVEADTEWHELWSHSRRKEEKTPLGGLTGTAVYYSDDWRPLLPWLVWGQATQAGKSAVKGNGVYELDGERPLYWDWLSAEGAGSTSRKSPLFFDKN